MDKKPNEENCPCCSGQTYENCCEPYITGHAFPQTPEALMRSRYTAYTQSDVAYIEKTMKPPALDIFEASDAKEWSSQLNWLGLEVIHSHQDGDKGTVEFIAHFSRNHAKHILHEVSEFRRDQGRWYYIDGKQPEQK